MLFRSPHADSFKKISRGKMVRNYIPFNIKNQKTLTGFFKRTNTTSSASSSSNDAEVETDRQQEIGNVSGVADDVVNNPGPGPTVTETQTVTADRDRDAVSSLVTESR